MNNYLFHATYRSRHDSIEEGGLKRGFDGCVYMAGPEFAHALQFVITRPQIVSVTRTMDEALDHFGEEALEALMSTTAYCKELDGREVIVTPETKIEKFIDVWRIDLDRLEIDSDRFEDSSNVEHSTDHNPYFFERDTISICYFGDVPREAIRFDREIDVVETLRDAIDPNSAPNWTPDSRKLNFDRIHSNRIKSFELPKL